jgi:hypothetical protein
MYICKICNYETLVRTAMYTHNKTKKHIHNKENYDRNMEITNNENKTEQEILKLKDKEIEELKEKLIIIEKEKEKLEVTAKIYKELSEKSKNINQGIIINNTNTNNLNYVNKHFKNAPPLKKLTNYNINGIDLKDDTQIDKLTENIIYSYKNKCLHKLIGDHIIENYKKDDLQLQSFHATDIARRKYLVKLDDNMAYLYDDSSDEIDDYNPEISDESEFSDNEYEEIKKDYENEKKGKIKLIKSKSKWTNDNEGIKISYLLFEPLIKQLIRLLRKKCRDYNNELKKNTSKIPTADEVIRFEALANILKEMDKDKLKKNINNYIAPHFGLDKK